MTSRAKSVRFTVKQALFIYGVLAEWKGYLEAGGWDDTDAEAEQLRDATRAVELFNAAFIRADTTR